MCNICIAKQVILYAAVVRLWGLLWFAKTANHPCLLEIHDSPLKDLMPWTMLPCSFRRALDGPFKFCVLFKFNSLTTHTDSTRNDPALSFFSKDVFCCVCSTNAKKWVIGWSSAFCICCFKILGWHSGQPGRNETGLLSSSLTPRGSVCLEQGWFPCVSWQFWRESCKCIVHQFSCSV